VSLDLRPLVARDLAWFVVLRNEVRDALHDPRSFTHSDACAWFGRGRTRYWVIERSGIRVGYFRFACAQTLAGGAWIGADVAPQFHRQGIALAAYPRFMELMESHLRVSSWWLEVLSTNAPALSLYARLGFLEVERHDLAGRQCSSIVMRAPRRGGPPLLVPE